MKLPAVFIGLFVLVFWTQDLEALCVKNDRANLRKGPGTQFRKLWEVYKYMPFKKVGSKGSWYRIQDLDGDIYWIHKKLVTKAYKCAAIKKDKANFRSGPGTKHSQVPWSPQPKYFSMKVLSQKGVWVHMEDEQGDRAWVHNSLIWIH